MRRAGWTWRGAAAARRARARAGGGSGCQASRGARREEIDAALARVAGVDAQLASLQKAKTDAEVLAPAAGVVTQKLTEAGELASPRTPLVVITDLEHAWANLFVPEPMIPRIRLGQAATVFTDAGGPGVPGTITFISPTAEFTPRNVQTSEEDDRSSYDRQRRQLVCVLKSAPVDADIPLP